MLHESQVIQALLPFWHTNVANNFSLSNIQHFQEIYKSLSIPSKKKCLGNLQSILPPYHLFPTTKTQRMVNEFYSL